jgi:histidine ammonia-lyase
MNLRKSGGILYKINGSNLDLGTFIQIARKKRCVGVAPESVPMIQKARDYVLKVVEREKPIYGINTGFGKLSDVAIDKSEVRKLQKNLLMSHACGVGDPFSIEVVRGMMLLRANALIKGFSGVRLEVIEKILEFLNHDVTPVVFQQGSLGASGDLAPLSHMCLPLIGLGEVMIGQERMDAKSGLKRANIKPLMYLDAKEGLSLINGTQAMTSVGAFTLYDAMILEESASASLALTMEALQAIIDAFDPRVHQLRNQNGQIRVAERVKSILKTSQWVTKDGELRIQDAYSIRCAPQVHGAVYDALQHAKTVIEAEMNAVTDNPIVFSEQEEVISAGNFHGEPIALVMDYLAISISELANISERRIERLVNSCLSNGMPPFLVKKPGINSGFMIVQYSAAALVSENKALAHPASVDSIPSSANQEDHVSMGTISARKAASILKNAQHVIAMELFTAAQAIGFRGAKKLALPTKRLYEAIRAFIPFIEEDTIMYPFIHQLHAFVSDGKVVDCIQEGDR